MTQGERVVKMFRGGYDTMRIAKVLGIRECEAYDALISKDHKPRAHQNDDRTVIPTSA